MLPRLVNRSLLRLSDKLHCGGVRLKPFPVRSKSERSLFRALCDLDEFDAFLSPCSVSSTTLPTSLE